MIVIICTRLIILKLMFFTFHRISIDPCRVKTSPKFVCSRTSIYLVYLKFDFFTHACCDFLWDAY